MPKFLKKFHEVLISKLVVFKHFSIINGVAVVAKVAVVGEIMAFVAGVENIGRMM